MRYIDCSESQMELFRRKLSFARMLYNFGCIWSNGMFLPSISRWNIRDSIGPINIDKYENDVILHAIWIWYTFLKKIFCYCYIYCCVCKPSEKREREEEDKQTPYQTNIELLWLFLLLPCFMCFPSGLFVRIA